jgi:multidrug efflux pump subunit AcrA (membrane-fusion protein)
LPTVQQHVYAPWDAVVEKILVDHGQQVQRGQPLLQLHSPILITEYEAAKSQRQKNSQRLLDIEARLLRETSLTASQRDELEGERISLANIQQIEDQSLARLERQLSALTVVAHFDGTVATWNVQDNLKDRPVRAGQWLLSLHQADAEWMFLASLPEPYAKEFQEAVKSGRAKAYATMTSDPKHPILVEYNCNDFPFVDFASPSIDRNSLAITSLPNASVLRLRFDVEEKAVPGSFATAGATARISIESGTGPLAWAFTKDFVRKVLTQVKLWI